MEDDFFLERHDWSFKISRNNSVKNSDHYPDEDKAEPGIFPVQGYNAMKLIKEISHENFDHRRPIPESTTKIVNVMEKGYKLMIRVFGDG